ncbi:hypothetical protein PORY_002841 [Pneumocystis oryctolagi]|uniref:Uncharacterized protein n=1 Tax=Pneumocystis oryctolagi TaxID=42067 RepID=A0ACB7CA52_9ASCO|nr:hypothetical protein PORY_002841 [Pneumocystis oryctolagi]
MDSKCPKDTNISEIFLKNRLKKQELLENLDLELNQRLKMIESYSLLLQNMVSLCGEMRLSRVPRAMRNMTLRELYSKHNALKDKENV